jgi:hypothetical protein
MQLFQPAVIEEWVMRLRAAPDEGGLGLDDEAAESLVSQVRGNPRLRSAEIDSETDIEAARETVAELLSRFDPPGADTPAERWETVRAELVDILGRELRRSYWDDQVPTVTSAGALRAVVENARLTDRDIAETVSDGLDGFYVGKGEAPDGERPTPYGEGGEDDEPYGEGGEGDEPRAEADDVVTEDPNPGKELTPGGADSTIQAAGMLNHPNQAEYQPEEAEDDRDDEPETADDGDGAGSDATEDE